MRRLWWISIVFALVARSLFSQELPTPEKDSLTDDMRVISSFYPRLEGSEGEKRAVAFIESRLASLGVAYTPFDFNDSDFEHSFSSCVRVELAGRVRDTLIVAVPLDQQQDAEEGKDGSVNIALALDLIRRSTRIPPPVSLTVLFLGAEFGDADVYPMGSTLFLRDFQPDYRAAVIYLNLRDVPTRIIVRGGGKGIVTPYWLMNRSVDALRAAGVPYLLRGDESQIFRMASVAERTAIEPYLKAGYPSVELEGQYGTVTARDSADWMASFPVFFSTLVQETMTGIPEDWDRHYLLFQLGDYPLIITEKAYLAILVVALSMMLLYSLASRDGMRKYLRTLIRNLPALLPITGIAFLFLFAGTFVLEGIQSIRGFSALWSYVPLPALLLKACVALFLYSALYNPARSLPFPRNGSFYSAAALFILLIDIAIVGAFNVSFTYYFLWAFLFVFLSALVRPRYAKVLLFIPAPFWGVRGLIDVFTTPALPLCHFLLLSPIWGNLFIAAACLPFILVVLRLGLVLPGRGLLKRRVREYVFAGALFLGTAVLAARLMVFSPFSALNPQPLEVTQALEISSKGEITRDTLSVTSPAPLRTITVIDASGSRRLAAPGTGVTLRLSPPAASPVKITQDSSAFFSQRTVTLDVAMPSSPRTMVATLSSAQDFILFDCSFPFIRESSNQYRILIGAFAPNPLELQLTLPAGGAFTLGLEMEFNLPLIGAQVSAPGDTRTSTRVRVQKSIEVKT
jgi:hypothetical protein